MKRLFIAIILILCSTDAFAATSVTIDPIEPKLNPATSQDSRPVYELLVPNSYYKLLQNSGEIEHPIWLRFRLKIDSDLTDSPRGFYRKTGNDVYEDFTTFVIKKNNLTENRDLIVREGISQPYDLYFKNFIGQSAMETQLEFRLPLTREILYENRQEEDGGLCLTFTMSRHQQDLESREKPFSVIIRPASFDITGEIRQNSTDAINLDVISENANVELEVCCGKNIKHFKPREKLNKSYDFKPLTGEDTVGAAVRIRPVFPYDVHPDYIEGDTKYLVRKYVKEDTAEAYKNFFLETARNPSTEPEEPIDNGNENKKIPNLTGELREKVKTSVDDVCIVEDFVTSFGLMNDFSQE